MKKFYLFLTLFLTALVVPFGIMVSHTLKSAHMEEIGEARFFAEEMFKYIEQELQAFVIDEETRPAADYTKIIKADKDYVLGYFQNSSEGKLVLPDKDIQKDRITNMNELNRKFNTVKKQPMRKVLKKTAPLRNKQAEAPQYSIQQKYITQKKSDRYDRFDDSAPLLENRKRKATESQIDLAYRQGLAKGRALTDKAEEKEEQTTPKPENSYAPMQTVITDDNTMFLFRKVVINDKFVNQGLAIDIKKLTRRISTDFYENQPISRYSSLTFSLAESGKTVYKTNVNNKGKILIVEHNFARPFGGLYAEMKFDSLPASPGRKTVFYMSIALIVIVLVGFTVIIKAMKVIMEHSARRSGFVSSVTHELKTPITNIGMYVEMLETGMADTPEKEDKYYSILKSEINRLSKLIQNILEFSKLESRTRIMQMEKGELKNIINASVLLMDERIKQEGFVIIKRTEVDVAAIYDHEAMLQILINLIDNSIKFSHDSPEKEITVSCREDKNMAVISVSDKGSGIPQNALGKVFDDFYRVDNSLTSRTKGTGIGLSLVKKLAEEMGGKAEIRNNKNSGCTVSVYLKKG